MATFLDYTDPYLESFTQVPAPGPGVCVDCHRGPNAGYQQCYSCAQTTGQVSRPAPLVVPISLYRTSSQMHHVLWGYKNSPDSATRGRLRFQVVSIVWRYLTKHADCIRHQAGDDWDHIAVVPSTRQRAGSHPLADALILAPPLRTLLDTTALTPGTTTVDHNRGADDAFAPGTHVSGLRYLLIDDTFTSGARMHSAASALQLAGATVVAALAIGRVVNPDWNAACQTIWTNARASTFTFDRCCLDPCVA